MYYRQASSSRKNEDGKDFVEPTVRKGYHGFKKQSPKLAILSNQQSMNRIMDDVVDEKTPLVELENGQPSFNSFMKRTEMRKKKFQIK